MDGGDPIIQSWHVWDVAPAEERRGLARKAPLGAVWAGHSKGYCGRPDVRCMCVANGTATRPGGTRVALARLRTANEAMLGQERTINAKR